MLSSPPGSSKRAVSSALRVLFLSVDRRANQGSRVYRCAHQAKQLRHAGLEAEVVFIKDVTDAQLAAADILIFARCGLTPRTAEIVRAARSAGKLLCGEVDDRIFAPWDVDATGYLRSRAKEMRDLSAREGFASAEGLTLQLLALLDAVLVSTPTLKSELAELGIAAEVFRNAIDSETVQPVRRIHSGLGRMLVMTGTRTHDADLRSIAKPLGRFLSENPSVTCTFLGPLELSSELRGLANVEKKTLLPIDQLYMFVASFDLCLVPLERSVFNDCKSAVKFIECGIVSVPVLASPRKEYCALIQDGENGFIASDEPDSWYQRLTHLRDHPQLIQVASQGAFATVQAQHTLMSRGSELADHLKELVANNARTRGAR